EFIGRHVTGRMNLKTFFFARGKIGSQREGNPTSQFALQFEQIGDLAIVGLVPNVLISSSIDQLSVDSDPIAFPTNRAFENVGNAESESDLTQVTRPRFVLPDRCSARDLE